MLSSTYQHRNAIIKHMYRTETAYLRAPRQFQCDNSGEFSVIAFREMNDKLNIETKTKAGELSFSNSIAERHNKICYVAIQTTIENVKSELEIALAWHKVPRMFSRVMEDLARTNWFSDTVLTNLI